jgi:hypothetical protein
MSEEIVKQSATQSAIETLRLLLTVDTEDRVAITKTGVKDGMRGLAVRGISVFQRWNEVRFGRALLQELEEMRSAGQIRDDFSQTDAGVSSLREFFEMIDGKPDEARFQAFCALFMSANAPNAESSEAILDLELMSILRNLSAGEMLLLSAFLKLGSYRVGDDLMDKIGKEMGFRSDALVGRNVTALLQQSLISEEGWKNRGGSHQLEKPLLTDLGIALRTRIEKYNQFKARQVGASGQAHE